jgi:hypothetical protein
MAVSDDARLAATSNKAKEDVHGTRNKSTK